MQVSVVERAHLLIIHTLTKRILRVAQYGISFRFITIPELTLPLVSFLLFLLRVIS